MDEVMALLEGAECAYGTAFPPILAVCVPLVSLPLAGGFFHFCGRSRERKK